MPPRFTPSGLQLTSIASSSRVQVRTLARNQSHFATQSKPHSHDSPTRFGPSTSRKCHMPKTSDSGRNDSLEQRRYFHASTPRFSVPSDPYKALGVSKEASAAEIKKAYFALAKKYHPDTSKEKGAKDKFVEIQAAYDVLSDKDKRAAFDRYGAASQQPGFDPDAFSNSRGPFGGGGFGGFQDFGGPFGAAGGRSQADLFESLFSGAFGGGGRAGRGFGFADANPRGEDIEVSVNVSFIESAKGTKRSVTLNPIVDCKPCSGSGLKSGTQRSTCSMCRGTGTRTFVVDSGFQMASTCPTCRGSGTVIPKGGQCGDCAGMGKVKDRKTVEVNIPAGVEQGMVIRVPSQGDAPLDGKGKEGDLLVRVNVQPSKTFRRQGNNIYYDGKIAFHSAILGDRVRVPTLDGDVEVRIPGGTQPGQEFVLKGKGVSPVFGGERGDQYVSFAVTIPRSLTPHQRELLQRYADDVNPKTGGTKQSNPATSAEGPSEGVSREQSEPPHGTTSFTAKPTSTSSNHPHQAQAQLQSSLASADDGGWLGWASNKLRKLF